jgi:hypothetical protein
MGLQACAELYLDSLTGSSSSLKSLSDISDNMICSHSHLCAPNSSVYVMFRISGFKGVNPLFTFAHRYFI